MLLHPPDFPLLWTKEATQIMAVAEVTTKASCPTVAPLFLLPPQYLFENKCFRRVYNPQSPKDL